MRAVFRARSEANGRNSRDAGRIAAVCAEAVFCDCRRKTRLLQRRQGPGNQRVFRRQHPGREKPFPAHHRAGMASLACFGNLNFRRELRIFTLQVPHALL